MKIQQIMTTSLVTMKMDDTLTVVKEAFDNNHFHHLLVIDDDSDELRGVISDRDLLKALSPNIGTISETTKDTASLNKKVHQIMTRHPVTLNQKADFYEAIETFNKFNVSCLPIVDDDMKLVGVISWRDILKVIEASRKNK